VFILFVAFGCRVFADVVDKEPTIESPASGRNNWILYSTANPSALAFSPTRSSRVTTVIS
jgi:hypothetical protein